MSWMNRLYQTYAAIMDKNLSTSQNQLTPIGHTIQNAHIEITLNGQGVFQTAKVLPPKTQIMLPATESSENRTSGEAPHPLADKIQYVAKDYADFGGTKKAYFDGYLGQLQKWCQSDFKHPKVQAVLNYVQKGRVVADLVSAGVLFVDNEGKILNKWEQESEVPDIFSVLPKTKGEVDFGSALVCWRVEMAVGDVCSETWRDQLIQQSWIDYNHSNATNAEFCMIQGKDAVISTMHPAKLRHNGDKAKLISSNDTAGYTFRGRFETAKEAASISAEVSAKAHSALRWLIGRQGVRNGEQVIVAWAVNGETVPSPLGDYGDMDFSGEIIEVEADNNSQSELDSHNIDHTNDLGQTAADKIKKKFLGYQSKLQAHEQISLLMLDSATPGRMALTYYQEFLPADYFANLDAWIDDFAWYQRRSHRQNNSNKTVRQTVWLGLPPSPAAIADTVYGKTLSDTLRKQLYARLLPVIAGGKNTPIPYDLVQKSFQAACNPNSGERWEWERNLGVACALYKGWLIRHHRQKNLSLQQGVYSMSLDTENRSRDYLYGRLLAIADNIESYALYLAEEKRATTAERYMQRFAEHPYSTWRNIELALKPYQDRLLNRQRDTGEQAISEVMVLFNPEDYINDSKLSGEFLLGFHCQKMAIRQKIVELSSAKQ